MNRKQLHKAFPVIETENLVLRNVRLSDSNDMFKYANDRETSKFVTWSPHHTLDDSKIFIKFGHKMLKEGYLVNWAITLKGEDRFIGTIGFGTFDDGSKRAEIGYWLGKDYWGKGIMTEALQAVIQYGFNTLNLNRIQCTHALENPASGKVMENAGMEFEGILKKYVFFKNRFWDLKMFSIINDKEGSK